jgi:GT2 family glycosyltransferase
MNRLTIATVTKNCLEYTKLFVDSLNRWGDIPYQLIVVDNNSDDGTKSWLSGLRNGEVIINRLNRGFGPGNNQAFKLSNTEYFLGLNNDTVIFPQFLSRLLEFADHHQEFAEFGFASNCIGAKNPWTGRMINEELKELNLEAETPGKIVAKYFPDPNTFTIKYRSENPGCIEMETPPHFTGGWGFLVRTEAVKKSEGLFDPQFRTGFWEDVDLSWRLAEAGYRICHINSLYLHHFTHVSFKANKLKYSDRTYSRRNALKFARKWSDTIRRYLSGEFESGKNLKQICHSIHIFGVFMGRDRNDWEKLEQSLKDEFIGLGVNFADLLISISKRDTS